MYQVTNIHQAMATRHVILKNMETGRTIDCFDDSAVVSNTNFDFMEMEKLYDCKIRLFGDWVEKPKNDHTVRCKYLADETVGVRKMAKIEVDGEIYYVGKHEIEKMSENNEFYYSTTRKDLIQVNDVVHGDYLHESYALLYKMQQMQQSD